VAIPTTKDEDAKRPNRERQSLVPPCQCEVKHLSRAI
jgi:hypothetical protein